VFCFRLHEIATLASLARNDILNKTMNDSLLWQIRHFVYSHFADTTHAPSVNETAAHFNISISEASEYYKELHNRHAFFLDLETLTVRMANPFSGIPTDFKVHANDKTYYANCAWHPRRASHGRNHRSRLHREQ
jgi:hypothetical protein